MTSHFPCKTQHRQRGVALIVALIFLLALSALAVFSARNATLGESMARNELDNQLARQAAEAALRDAERDLLLTTGAIHGAALCARGYARPVLDAINSGFFTEDCKGGQCYLGLDRYGIASSTELAKTTGSVADYASSTSSATAEPWWPVDKGGAWNNSAASAKPSPENGAINCDTFKGGVPLGTFTGAPPIAGVVRQPEYLIEFFRRGSTRYFRITARGFGYSASTQIVMQSYFKPFA